jgi:hypothetical protein
MEQSDLLCQHIFSQLKDGPLWRHQQVFGMKRKQPSTWALACNFGWMDIAAAILASPYEVKPVRHFILEQSSCNEKPCDVQQPAMQNVS